MVCVLMSTYNGEKYLAEQLDSILSQRGVNIKLLIRDDGSKDSTNAIIESYINNSPEIIHLHKGENVGFAKSFTLLLQMGYEMFPECEYFAFADQDDVWLEDKLYSALSKLQNKSKELPITYCSNTTLVRKDLSVIGDCWKPQDVKLSKERALIKSFATGCTMVFNRCAVKIYITHIPQELKVHDFYMYQLCMFLGKVIFDEKSHILYRQHGNNQIGKKNFKEKLWNKLKYGDNSKEHVLEKQNYYLLKALKDLLSIEDISLISKVAFYRMNIWTRLNLLFDLRISHIRLEQEIMYLLKIIKGGV